MAHDFDFIIVGSGFGGSVAALRLTEKGYRVAVLEAGRRFGAGDYPKTNWDARRFLWAPVLGCYGIQRLTLLDDVLVFSGTGVGGGSLVYANTLLVPPEPFFRDPQWAGMDADWRKTLTPFYDTAKRMLGVTRNPKLWKADEMLQDYARELGREAHFQAADVGVFFGDPDREVPDPFFGGEGPPRTGCDHNGHCMVGCEHGGKNSLDRNYLYLAEKKGAVILPDTTVTDIIPVDGGYRVVSHRTQGFLNHPRTERTAMGVVVAAGALNTNRLLMENRDKGNLPKLSARLGKVVRTNSELLNGVVSHKKDYDYSQGIAITSSLFVDDVTHVEPVRYPAGSDFMGMLGTFMIDGGGSVPRWIQWIGRVIFHPVQFLTMVWWIHGWAKRAIICLVMQTLDNHIDLELRRRWWWPFSRRLASRSLGKAPTHIPQGNAAARALAKRMDGTAMSAITEVVFERPVTAHILGGCPIGPDAEHGVVDKRCRVYGYNNLYVTDGAMIPANLGVNPSLSITALAEHAMSQVPAKAAV